MPPDKEFNPSQYSVVTYCSIYLRPCVWQGTPQEGADKMVRTKGLEPPTSGSANQRSNPIELRAHAI